MHVYVRRFPEGATGGRWQITTASGRFPLWARNGKELFFESTDTQMIMVAEYSTHGDTFIAGKPRPWSNVRLQSTGVVWNLDLAPDGKRFAVIPSPERNEEKTVSRSRFC
jgi:hypothetical protein